jgi:hypothetical protein
LLLLKNENISSEKLLEFTNKYSAVLQKYSINHSDADFLQFQLERPEMYPWNDFGKRLWIRIILLWNAYFLSLLLGFMTIFMFLAMAYGLKQVPLF